MKRILSASAFLLASAAGLAAVSPLSAGGRELTRMPVDPIARSAELATKKVTLAQALASVSKLGGYVGAAAYGAQGQIEISMYKEGVEHALVVDAGSGELVSDAALPPFPGEPVKGPATATANGVLCYDLKVGDGAEVIARKSGASVHCTGWLLDGTKFWSSLDGAGQPLQCSMTGGLIGGWLEGIPGMKVGGKRKLVIPSTLGYGSSGRPPAIPPNAVLVFDIELLSVN